MKPGKSTAQVFYLLIANALVIGAIAYAAVLERYFADFYYLSIQEDEYVEWASFWAFLLASIVCVVAARRYRRLEQRSGWYFYGLALFCFLIAMEEISWGQRVLGYRPPVYFLEHNYQQELNIHNVVPTDYRKLILMLSIVGYGIALPLSGSFKSVQNGLRRVGIVTPHVGLLPAFAATALVYYYYPFSHSGEWVELMLGTGILFSVLPFVLAAARAPGKSPQSAAKTPSRLPAWSLGVWTLVLLLGLASGAASRAQRDAHPGILETAATEIEALKSDFESGRVRSRCSLHKRLYTFVVQYEQDALLRGAFSRLEEQGLPAERADFLLDPWNSPYWIRDRCDRATRRRVVFVYSFGPNRRRDSSALEIRGDDIGAYIDTR